MDEFYDVPVNPNVSDNVIKLPKLKQPKYVVYAIDTDGKLKEIIAF